MPLLVDLAVVFIVVLAAWSGWRRGGLAVLVRLACGLAGLVAGFAGAGLLSDSLSPVGHVVLGAICALGGLVLGAAIGRRLTRRLGPPGVVDRGLGVVVRGGIAAVLCGLVASTVVAFGPPLWATAVQTATLVPDAPADVPVAGAVWTRVAGVLRTTAPDDLAALVPAAVDEGPDAATVAAVDRAVGDRVVRVSADRCGDGVGGTGFVAAAGLVVTNAHVVAGASSITVGDRTATVVAFDRRSDLAVLRVSGLDTTPLTLAPADAPNGSRLVVIGFPEGGGRSAVGAAVVARLPTPNPGFSDGAALHEAYRLHAPIHHGNSGSPLLDTSGRVVGVVNALTGSDGTEGYAISLDELRPVLAAAAARTAAVSTGVCA